MNVIRTLNYNLTRNCVDIRIIQNGIETGNTDATFSVSIANRMVSGTLDPDDVNNVIPLSIAIQDNDGELLEKLFYTYNVAC